MGLDRPRARGGTAIETELATIPTLTRLSTPRGRPCAGGYVVRDANSQIIAWVYARASTAEAMQAKVLTLDEARRVATNIARLPELLGRDDQH